MLCLTPQKRRKNKFCTQIVLKRQKKSRKPSIFKACGMFSIHSISFTRKFQTVFSCSFRTSNAYHLIRFSIYSYRSNATVPKVYPKRQSTIPYSIYHFSDILALSLSVVGSACANFVRVGKLIALPNTNAFPV